METFQPKEKKTGRTSEKDENLEALISHAPSTTREKRTHGASPKRSLKEEPAEQWKKEANREIYLMRYE